VFDLPRHHGLRHPGILEQLEQGTELTERNPVEGRCGRTGRQVGQLRKRFVLEADDGDLMAGASSRVENKEGKPPVAGDKA